MNLLAPISSIMSKDLVTVHPEDTMKRVEELFRRHNIHHLPVIEEGKLIGMVSKSDYLFFKRGFNDQSTDKNLDMFRLKVWKVSDVMTTKLAKMEPEDRINVALDVFEKNIFHAIPIVKDDKIVGIVSSLDIIRHLAEDRGAVNKYENA